MSWFRIFVPARSSGDFPEIKLNDPGVIIAIPPGLHLQDLVAQVPRQLSPRPAGFLSNDGLQL